MEKLITIITRTSGRPNGFNATYNSIASQTYKNIRHLVCVDDDASAAYVSKYNVDCVKVNRTALIDKDFYTDQGTGPYYPHNLYFNEAIKFVADGSYVLYLDDDDRLADKDSIQKMVDKLTDDGDTMVMFQMSFPTPNGRIALPTNENLGKEPQLGGIGGSCFLFNKKYMATNGGLLEWDSWKCADYRFISKLYTRVKKIVTIQEQLIYVGQIGGGNKTDLNIK